MLPGEAAEVLVHDEAPAPVEKVALALVSSEPERTPRDRSFTVSIARLSARKFHRGTAVYAEQVDRPRTRAECPAPDADGVRRCAYVSCKYNRALDVSEATGSIKFNIVPVARGSVFDGNVEELDIGAVERTTCTLDLAEADGMTLEQIAADMNITRERVRQITDRAVARLQRDPRTRAYLDPEEYGGGGDAAVSHWDELELLAPGSTRTQAVDPPDRRAPSAQAALARRL